MICANDGCDNTFEKSTHNQKYCCDTCCREATNKKIRDKYYEQKERLAGKTRRCSYKSCKRVLSRYNEDSICNECMAKLESDKRQELFRIINVSR